MTFSEEHCSCCDDEYCCRVINTHCGPIIYFNDKEDHITTFKARHGKAFEA